MCELSKKKILTKVFESVIINKLNITHRNAIKGEQYSVTNEMTNIRYFFIKEDIGWLINKSIDLSKS